MKSYKDLNATTYDVIAQNYKSEHEDLIWENELHKFISSIQKPSPVIVDLGSGHGREAQFLAQNLSDATIYAVDVSAAMLKISPQHVDAIKYIKENMVTFTPPQKVDGIWARASIHHLTKPEMHELFLNIGSYLNKGGILGMVNKYGHREEIEEKNKYDRQIKRYFQYVDENLVDALIRPLRLSIVDQYKVHNDHDWLVTFLKLK